MGITMTENQVDAIRRDLQALMVSVGRIDERTERLAEDMGHMATKSEVAGLATRVGRHDTIISRISWGAVATVSAFVAQAVGLKPPHF